MFASVESSPYLVSIFMDVVLLPAESDPTPSTQVRLSSLFQTTRSERQWNRSLSNTHKSKFVCPAPTCPFCSGIATSLASFSVFLSPALDTVLFSSAMFDREGLMRTREELLILQQVWWCATVPIEYCIRVLTLAGHGQMDGSRRLVMTGDWRGTKE